jgi:hypothetical protein
MLVVYVCLSCSLLRFLKLLYEVCVIMPVVAAAAVAAALLSVPLAHAAKPRIHTNNRSALVLYVSVCIPHASTSPVLISVFALICAIPKLHAPTLAIVTSAAALVSE